MSNIEAKSFVFESSYFTKIIYFEKSFTSKPVIKLTPLNNNVILHLSEVQNNYFIVSKNSSETVNVNYIAIESI